jgi:hypothetical protein
MSKLNQIKIPVSLVSVDDLTRIAVEQNVIEDEFNWELVREHDGLVNKSKDIIWLEFGEDGKFKAKHDKPAIELSLLMSPFNGYFTWQTTPVLEIITDNEECLKFKTKNSVYTLTKISNK